MSAHIVLVLATSTVHGTGMIARMDQVVEVAQRRGAPRWVFADLASGTLTLTIAVRRTLISAHTGRDLPSAARATQTASQRLRWTLQYARAVQWIPGADSDRHLRAGIARWSDAVDATSAATASADVDIVELERGLRAGEAGEAELRRWALAFPRPVNSSRGHLAVTAPRR